MLSPRQTEILALMAEGHGNQEIADRLGMGKQTVMTRAKQINLRLEARNRTHAVALGYRLGLLGEREGAEH